MKKIKSKKSEVNNQILVLCEKETKIRKQEAHLQLQELKLREKDKELKDRAKLLSELSKRRQGSKSPITKITPRGGIGNQTQQLVKNSSKFGNIKNNLDQYISSGG